MGRRRVLVGREVETEALGALLDRRWHVTIVGTAGVGKTRLANEVLHRRSEPFVACDLTEAEDADDVLNALARLLAVEPGEGTAIERIGAVLAAKGRFHLLLDGVDRLSATAWDQTVSTILEACPELHVLATARARLRVEGEAIFALDPLATSLPTPNGESPAERLYLELAEDVLGRDLREGGEVPDDVRALVRLLDGLPLAIEIAASMVRVLSAAEFTRRSALVLDAPNPGQSWSGPSLRAAFEVSWSRLPEAAQRALVRLSVLVADFDLEAAEAITGESALDPLAALCEASLATSFTREDRTRFHLFECVRQFANEREGAADVVTAARARHREYFGTQGGKWARNGESRDRLRALQWLTAEESNMLAAAARVADLAAPTEVDIAHGAGAMAGLMWLWLGRGPLDPQAPLLDRMESLVRPHVLRSSRAIAVFELTLVNVRRHRREIERALTIIEDALSRARELADPYLVVRCLLERARLARLRDDRPLAEGSIEEAETLADPSDPDVVRLHLILGTRIVSSLEEPALVEASVLAQRVGDPLATASVELAYATFCFANGRPGDALEHVRLVDEAAAQLRQHTWRALASLVAGNALAEQGKPIEARVAFETALRIGLATAHRRSEAEARANIALLDFEAGRLAEAAEGLTEATRLFSKRDPTRLYFMAALAGVEASDPLRAEGAAKRFTDARNEALRIGPQLVVEIDRFGEMFQLRSPNESANVIAGPSTTAALSASRVARRVRESIRARLGKHAFVVAKDGTWFRPPEGVAVSLAARPVLMAVVRELLRARGTDGGIVARDALTSAIWPEEKSSRKSMGNRLSVALSTLRALGLTAIVSTPQGLALDGGIRISDTPND